MVTRRTLLKAGMGGGLLLAAAGWYALREPERAGGAALSTGAREVLAGVVPVMLEGALPASATRADIEAVVDGVQRAVAGLAPATQREIGQLFALLGFAPFRFLFCDLSRPWREAPAAEVRRFLERWRDSRIGLLYSGYAALHDLIFGAWYADAEHWTAIGYPGPPDVS